MPRAAGVCARVFTFPIFRFPFSQALQRAEWHGAWGGVSLVLCPIYKEAHLLRDIRSFFCASDHQFSRHRRQRRHVRKRQIVRKRQVVRKPQLLPAWTILDQTMHLFRSMWWRTGLECARGPTTWAQTVPGKRSGLCRAIFFQWEDISQRGLPLFSLVW